MTAQATLQSKDELELTLVRDLKAPRHLVFEMWTDVEHMRHWFGPKDFDILEIAGTFEVGLAWHASIRSAKGKDYLMKGVCKEIIPDERIVFTQYWCQEDGSTDHETLVTVTFEDNGDGTRLTFHQGLFLTAENCASHIDGWEKFLDRLSAHLTS